MNRTRTTLLATLLTALSSGAFILSFPPHAFAWLPWFALVPLLVALQIVPGRSAAAGLAAGWGLMSAYGITAWLPRAIANYYEQPFLLGLGLFVATSILMGSSQRLNSCAARERHWEPAEGGDYRNSGTWSDFLSSIS